MKSFYSFLFPSIQLVLLPILTIGAVFGAVGDGSALNDSFARSAQQHSNDPETSVLATGEWYRFAVKKRGVHKISSADLLSAGINITNIKPRMIRVHGYGNGILPQLNGAERPYDLPELAIYVGGEADGKFDTDDYILFFAEGPDKISFNELESSFEFAKNLYADSAYYFLSLNESPGIRIQDKANTGINHPKVKSFKDFLYHEEDIFNILSSGREWFGEQFIAGSSKNFSYEILDVQPGTEFKFRFKIMSSNASPSAFAIKVNNSLIGEIPVEAIPRVNQKTGLNTYAVKGKESEKYFNHNITSLPQNRLSLDIAFKGTAGDGFAYLNNFSFQFDRSLKFREDEVIFNNASSLAKSNVTFEIENNTIREILVWNVSDPLKPTLQVITKNNQNILFGSSAINFQTYSVFDPGKVPTPAFVNKVVNQNIKAAKDTELLIVSYPEFLNEAERLASFRESHDNFKVTVVTPAQIYNEFSSGRQDVSAIRDYVKYLYENGNIKYLLLFGKCSYAYKDLVIHNTNFVPTYQSFNSLHPVETYSSDDYFGFMDDEEGIWPENDNPGNHQLEIGVGRLPVKTSEEARVVVDKIIHYSSHPDAFGSWRNEIVFVADDEDGNTHQKDAERLAAMIDTVNKQYHVNKIYLGAFPQEGKFSSVATRDALNDAIKKGALIVNYSGHGNESVWADERILNISMINEWENYDKLSLFVTATCEFGKYDSPLQISGGEMLLLSPKGGAIALVTTSRPVYSNTNYLLNSALYDVIFTKNGAESLRLGDIIKSTKNNSLSGYRNRNFSLLGDPSLKLSFPRKEIVISDILSEGQQIAFDTLRASSKILIKGYVTNGNNDKDLNFSGLANVTIYDKASTSTTLNASDNGPVMSFKEQNKVLFKGKVSIKDGDFGINFVVPKNIDYAFGTGKISIYGYDKKNKEDASSGFTDIVIGGSVTPLTDNKPPLITLYMDDESFRPGGLTGSNTLLLARLEDESGINISSSGFDQDISASLNQNKNYNLSSFFEYDLDDYKRGWVSYPINGLEDGRHKLILKAWDINSNYSEESVDFIVSSHAKIALHNVMNYPNPFYSETTFSLNHNRAGDDLEIHVIIYSMKGEVVRELNAVYNNSVAHLDELVWDGTNSSGLKLSQGIYTYKVIVRSLSDQSKTQEYSRLVLIK